MKKQIRILAICVLMSSVIFVIYIQTYLELTISEPSFETVSESMARQMFENPSTRPSFIRGIYPDAGSTVSMLDVDEICVSIIGEGFEENLNIEDLQWRLSTRTFLAVNNQPIEVGAAYLNTILYADLTTNFSICSSVKSLDTGVHVVQMVIQLTEEIAYEYTWAFKAE